MFSNSRFTRLRAAFRRINFSLRLASIFVITIALTLSVNAQQPTPTLLPPPPPPQDDETLSVTTEEVFVPVLARDDAERFDPTLEPDDILILENGVAQKLTSVRHLPASVLFVLDTTGTDNRAMRTSTTRAVALAAIARLRPDDRVAILEQGKSVRRLQEWTTDPLAIGRSLRTQLSSGNPAQSARFTDAMNEAAAMFAREPHGNRHVIFITDGVERFDGKSENLNQKRFDAGRAQLSATGALIHVLSYAKIKFESSTLTEKDSTEQVARTRGENGLPNTVTAMGDPTRAAGINRGDALGSLGTSRATITFDRAMRRRRQAYSEALKASEARLGELTATLGGKLWLPASADEMIEQSRQVGIEIGAQYTVTYKPQRAFATGEQRRLEVASRRVGLRLETRRRFVTATRANAPID